MSKLDAVKAQITKLPQELKKTDLFTTLRCTIFATAYLLITNLRVC
jgi:hypothetical protein